MTKKRRIFDIELPEDPGAETFPAGKVGGDDKRRGPMATAITENAEALRDRQEVEARIRSENDALAHEHVRLKRAGLIVDLVPLDQIETYKLTRDRIKGDDLELTELVASIRELGLSNPIRIEPRADGRYELVQGYRRLSAYQTLLAATGDTEAWGKIPAGILARGEALETLYRRMVDENLVRKDISFAEMALLALNYVADPGTAETDPEKAVAVLFQSAGYQKRSYIRAFIKVMDRLQGILRYPQHLPRSLGLALAERMDVMPEIVGIIRADLRDWDMRTVADELAVLRRYAGTEADFDGVGPAQPGPSKGAKTGALPQPKTMFQLARPQGKAKCTAGAGRLEIRLDRDFSAIDRRRLEAAVQLLLDNLD